MMQKHICKYSFIPASVCSMFGWINMFLDMLFMEHMCSVCMVNRPIKLHFLEIFMPPRYMPLSFFFLHLHSFLLSFSHKFITKFIILCIHTNTYSLLHVHLLKYSLSCFSFPLFPRFIIPTKGTSSTLRNTPSHVVVNKVSRQKNITVSSWKQAVN